MIKVQEVMRDVLNSVGDIVFGISCRDITRSGLIKELKVIRGKVDKLIKELEGKGV